VTASSPYVPLIIQTGESNSGGTVPNASATAPELAPRSEVKIINNTGLVFETLDVGTNNLIDHFNLTNNTTHSWELQLANQVAAGSWGAAPVYLIKTGQGGSKVAEWATSAGAYQVKVADRHTPALAELTGLGKTPTPVIWMSIGINDSLAGTSQNQFRIDLQRYISAIRRTVGVVPVIMTHLTPAHVAYDAYIDQVAADMVWCYAFDTATANANLLDAQHWGYTGQKANADAFMGISLDSANIGLGATYLANKALYDGSVARAGTVWDINGKGSNVDLLGQRQYSDSRTSGFNAVRGSTGKSSGKHYCEIKIKGVPPSNGFFAGVMDATTAAGAGLNTFNPTNSAMTRDDGFASPVGFTTVGSGGFGTLAAGDVIGIAVDASLKMLWLAKNNVWRASGDPVGGLLPYFTWVPARTVFPCIAMQNTCLAELVPSSFTYSPPSGFSSWD
jgi:hypothetical protein